MDEISVCDKIVIENRKGEQEFFYMICHLQDALEVQDYARRKCQRERWHQLLIVRISQICRY